MFDSFLSCHAIGNVRQWVILNEPISLIEIETQLNFCMVSLMRAQMHVQDQHQTLLLGHPLSSCQSAMFLYTSHKYLLDDYVWGQSCPKPVAAYVTPHGIFPWIPDAHLDEFMADVAWFAGIRMQTLHSVNDQMLRNMETCNVLFEGVVSSWTSAQLIWTSGVLIPYPDITTRALPCALSLSALGHPISLDPH